MKKFIYTAIAFVTMAMATSCEKDVFNSTSNEGGFSLSLNVNNQETVTSRAVMSAEEVKNSAKVKIYMPKNTGLIREYTYGDMEPVIYLPTGNEYRVDVIAGEAAKENPNKANFENKSYAGSANFDIVANKITENVKVTAKINNAITNVTFDQTITDNFNEGYTLTFALAENESNADNTLVYSATQTGEGYFIVDDPLKENKLYWSFVGTKKSDSTVFKANGAIEAPESTAGSLVGTRHTMNFKYVVKDGKLTFTLVVDKDTNNTTHEITWNPKSTGLSTIKNKDIWAKFVTIGGDVDTKDYDGNKETADVFDADVYVQYRVKSDAEWAAPTAVTDDMVKVTTIDKGAFSQVITSLEPTTEYQCRMVINKINIPTETEGVTTNEFVVIDGVTEFTTAVAQQVPNASFESGYPADKYDVFNPQNGYGFTTTVSSDDDSAGVDHTWWGTGNQVQYSQHVDVTKRYSNTDIPNYSENNKWAVEMTSKIVATIKLAAGNIYSGYFYTLHGIEGGTVHFGRNKDDVGSDFVSRPTGVSFYVKYISSKVEKANGGGLTTNDMDEGQVKVAIGNWSSSKGGGSKECPIAINTTESSNPPAQWNLKTFEGTIAYCDMIFTQEHNDEGWMKVTIPLEYNNYTTTPTHILISAASSRLGDYFTGGKSSMYLDDIELLYDYETSQLTGPKIEKVQ